MLFETGILLVLSIIAALFIGVFTRFVLKGSRLPYTVALLLIGLAVGLFDRYHHNAEAYTPINQALELLTLLDPHLILFVFLPILIFESAFALEVHLFRRIFSQIAILAVPGLIVSTLATACFVMWLLPVQWSWTVALLFGALISATDPVAVVALLKEICSRKRLETLVEGESLLNDGTAIVLFTLFLSMLSAGSASIDLLASSANFLWVVFLGLTIGFALGGLSLLWIGRIFNDPLVEICLSIGTAYLVYFVAEFLFHASGVVALVSAALLFAGIGRTQISSEVIDFIHHFWEVMAYIANTLIFLLVGLLIAKRLEFDNPALWWSLAILYVGLQLIRAGSIVLFMPLLKRVGIGITREKALVLIWGGLRGAVAMALALSLVQGDLLAPTIADQILFLCAGVVVLTLLINATTMAWLLKKLGLDQLPPAKLATMQRATRQIQVELNEYIPKLEQDEFLQHADWQSIKAEYQKQQVDMDSLIAEEDLSVAFKRRLLEAERKYYWIQYHQGLTDKDATQSLVESVERALDGTPVIYPRDKLAELWNIPPMMHWTRNLPFINQLIVNFYYRRMSQGYDITCGFIRAQKEIINYIDKLAPNAEMAEQIRQEVDTNITDAHERTAMIRQVFPEVIQELETSAAKSLLLRRQRAIIQTQVEHAVLDKTEAQTMIEQIEEKLSEIQNSQQSFEQASVAGVLQQQEWTKELPVPLFDQLVELGEHRVFAAGDTLFHFGDSRGALLIVVRGTAELIHPMGNEDGNNLYTEGQLLGLEFLQGGALKYSVIAKSPLDCIWLNSQKLRKLIGKYPELKVALCRDSLT